MKTFEQVNNQQATEQSAQGKLISVSKSNLRNEKADGSDMWEVCNKYVVTNNEFTVTGLTPGSKPLFRIVAINEYGESRYSNIVGPIICEDDIVFPGIEVLGFKEIENGGKLEIYAKVSNREK